MDMLLHKEISYRVIWKWSILIKTGIRFTRHKQIRIDMKVCAGQLLGANLDDLQHIRNR